LGGGRLGATFHGKAPSAKAAGMTWFELYAAVGVPVVLVLMGFGALLV
jgi:hypothetical protein